MSLTHQSSENVIADLRKSLAWLDLALATLNEGVIVLDADMRVLFANDAMADMVDQPRIVLLGMFVWEVLTLEKSGELITRKEYMTALNNKSAESLSGIYDLRSGPVSFNAEMSVAHIPVTEHTIVVVRDVTERLQAQAQHMKIVQEKAARKAAELSEQRMLMQYQITSILAGPLEQKEALQRILEIVCTNLGWNIGSIWEVNSNTDKLEYLYSWSKNLKAVSPFVDNSRRLSFKKGKGLPGRVWEIDEAVWVEDVLRDKNFPRSEGAKKLDLHGAFAIPLKSDGEFFGVMEFFSNRIEKPNIELLTSMATIGIQIAEFMSRKSIENALRESERRLRFMADSMPHMIYTARPDGKLDYINPQCMQYSGLPAEELLQTGWEHFIHPDDLKQTQRVWKNSLKTGEPFQLERRLRRYDGVYHWHLSRGHALRDEAGQVVMWIGTDTDIEDLKRNMELEEITASLREQRAHLLELNRAKDEFISLASHQLRTPATGVKQFLGMLVEGYGGELTETQNTFAEKAYESNERQIIIVNDLLKVAQVDAGKVTLKKEKTDLVVLMKSIIDEQSDSFAERRQKVVYNYSNDKLPATVDPKNFRMALENIVDNASKYTEPDKRITISIRKEGGSAVIAIKDQGVGIDKEHVDKIFNKFTRIDNPLSVEVGGTGLGLYWSRKIIELHDGSIKVESKAGKGSTFTVTVPLK